MAKQTHLDIQLLSQLAGEAGKALVLAAQGTPRGRAVPGPLPEHAGTSFGKPAKGIFESPGSGGRRVAGGVAGKRRFRRPALGAAADPLPAGGKIPLAGASGLAARLETAAAGLCGNKKQAEEHILRLQTLLLQTTKNAEQSILSLPGLCRRTPELLLSLEAAPDIFADAFIPLRRLPRPWSASA